MKPNCSIDTVRRQPTQSAFGLNDAAGEWEGGGGEEEGGGKWKIGGGRGIGLQGWWGRRGRSERRNV